MARQKPPVLKQKENQLVDMTLADFSGGYNSFLDEGRTPLTAARDTTNMMLKQDAIWSTRWGTATYGQSFTGPVDGRGTATKNNGDGTFTQYLLIVDNGQLKRSNDGGPWTTVTLDTGVTNFTTGYHVDMVQINNRVYMANGKDVLRYYDIVADLVRGFTGLATPAAPTLTRSANLSAGSYNLWYRISAVNAVGETIAGAANASFTVNVPRNSWQNNSTTVQYIDLAWSAVPSATRYNIYFSDQLGAEVYLDSVTASAYRDDSSAAVNEIYPAPVGDTTTGPILGRLAISENRLWGTQDPGNPWRVYWSGTGQFQGAFSPFYGGGYIDLEKGGGERPTQIKHYRDGKGDSQTTVFTTNQDGTGSEWQIALNLTQIGNVTYITPSAFKIVGSTGSNSPDGVIEARNNIYFPSTKGFFTTGAKPQLLNVLSTDEISLPMRPDIRNLNNAQSSKFAGIYYALESKIIWAVATGNSTDNNEIWILDLEQNAWMRPWTVPVKGFISYTSSDGKYHLLAQPVTGTKFIEFSESFLGDQGVAFSTAFRSGLIHFDKNHRQFAIIKYAYIEVARPLGTLQFTLLGTKKNKSFATLGSITISDVSGTSGFSTELFSDMMFSSPAGTPTTFSQSSVKKRIKINKKVNNIQLQVTSNSATTSFSINQFMIRGHFVNTADPSSWKK